MDWLRPFRAIRNRMFANSSATHPGRWLLDVLRSGDETDSGITVDTTAALSYAPIWYAVNKIAGHVGQLPCVLFQADGDRQKSRALRHPCYRLMKQRPNPWMSSIQFRETLTAHALLNGNGRAIIERNNRSDPATLIPVLPSQAVTVMMNGEKWHVITDSETGDKTKIPDKDMIHICGLSYDGLQGYSVLHLMRNSVGLGLAGEKVGNRHFRNNSTPGVILEAPPGAFKREEDARKFLSDWNTYHSGIDNSNRTAMLRDGIKASTLSVNARDAQWIEQRQFQRQEAALWMLLEQILGDDSSVSYNSLEQKNMAYLTNCLMKWLTKWEAELNAKLLTDLQQRTESHYFKFVVQALLRGTTKERYEVYQIARMIEVMSANDVRELEDMNAVEGGDEYENPANRSYNDTQDQTDQQSMPDAASQSDSQATGAIEAALNPPAEPGQIHITYTLSSDKQQEPKNPPASAVPRKMIESRLGHILSYERDRVQEAARYEANFLSWLDGFYSEPKFIGTLRSVYELMNAPALVDSHVTESREALLHIAGRCHADTFAATVVADTSHWPGRASQIADVICSMEGLT